MTELDRIYEDIERLLEGNKPLHYKDIKKEDIDNASKNGYTPIYVGNGNQLVLAKKDTEGNIMEYATINVNRELEKRDQWKNDKSRPDKNEEKTNEFNKNLGLNNTEEAPVEESQVEEATVRPINQKFLDIIDPNQDIYNKIKALTDKDIKYITLQNGKVVFASGYSQQDIDSTRKEAESLEDSIIISKSNRLKEEETPVLDCINSIFTPEIQQKLGDNKVLKLEWADEEDFEGLRFITSDNQFTLNDLQGNEEPKEEEPPEAAQDALNTNNQLNYRLKAVIDSPQIQQKIDDAPNGIDHVGIKGDKISIYTKVEESIIDDLVIPTFLSRFMEDKDVEIGSIGAGKQTNLNLFLTPEIQNYIKSKGNPNITKVMLGKDGLVWLMDDKNNPYNLDDMKVNDEVSTKGQEGNSFNVFINNGGANGQGGADGQGSNSQSSGNGTSNGSQDGSHISNLVTRTDLVNLQPEMKSRVKLAQSSIAESLKMSFNDSKESNYNVELKSLDLGKVINGTFLNESVIREATTEEKKEDKSEDTKKTVNKTTTGDTEMYITGVCSITKKEPVEEKPIEEKDEIIDAEESLKNHFFNAINEALQILREAEGEPAEDAGGEPAEDEISKDPAEDSEITEEEQAEKEKKELEKVRDSIILVSESAVIEALNTGKAPAKDTAEKASGKLKNLWNSLNGKTENLWNSLNGKTESGIVIKTKEADKESFTGKTAYNTTFNFLNGNANRIQFERVSEDSSDYNFSFTVIITKGSANKTLGSKISGGFEKATGVGRAFDSLAHNNVGGNKSETV